MHKNAILLLIGLIISFSCYLTVTLNIFQATTPLSANRQSYETKIGAGHVIWPTNWSLICNDPDDGVSAHVEILKLEYGNDSMHDCWRITTEGSANASIATYGVLINHGSNDNGWDAACGSSYSGVVIANYYQWYTADSYWWSRTGLDQHIRVNYEIFGVELALEKASLLTYNGFSLNLTTDYFKAITDSSRYNTFENEWYSVRDPITPLADNTATQMISEKILFYPCLIVFVFCIYAKRKQFKTIYTK